MEDQLNIKQKLIDACTQQLNQRIESIQKRLDTITDSRNNATKSSAGDKYETSRAMMQIEEEKSKRQMAEARKVQADLVRLNWEKVHDKAFAGSLVKTNKGSYFIAIGIGRINLDKQMYFCISSASPIGQVLLGKQAGESFTFNGQQFHIEAIT